jgi:EF hand
MNKIAMLAATLLVGTVVGAPAALAQTTIAPNSGAGVPGLPGNKSGPAVKPGEQSNVRPDQSNVPGLPGSKSGPALQPRTGLQNQAQGNEQEDEDQGGYFRHHPGMMGMMERGYGHHGWSQGRRAMSPTMMHIIFSLMDADGDGKLTLQEWQAAHERIFKAMDTDHDGTVTMQEMVTFMRGYQ